MLRSPHRVPPGDGPVFSLQWHITDACDQRCRHCYLYAEDPGRRPEEVSWEDMLRTVESVREFSALLGRRPMFFITGGDPLLHPDFWRLLEHLSRLGIAFAVMGNPFHLTARACRRLKRLGCDRYQMSLDGLEETHDALRKPGSFRETLEKTRLLDRCGLTSVLMTTVSSINVGELPRIIRQAAEARAGIFSFARYCPTGPDRSVGISPEEYREALKACRETILALQERGCGTRFDKKEHLWTLLDYEEGRFAIPPENVPGVIYGGCHLGQTHLTVLPNGDVYACRRIADSRVGNLHTDRLSDIWITKMDAYRQYERFEKCGECALLCYCRGCPAVAAGSGRGFYGPDPQCWKAD